MLNYLRLFLYYYFSIREFFTSALINGFPMELNDSKFPLVSRTLLSILADLNNVVVWTVSTLPLFPSHPPLVPSL